MVWSVNGEEESGDGKLNELLMQCMALRSMLSGSIIEVYRIKWVMDFFKD